MKNKKDVKIRFKTILIWFLYSLEIKETRLENVKYSQIQWEYLYQYRLIPCILFFIMSFIPALFIGGVPAIREHYEDLFKDHIHGDMSSDLNETMTKTFAYNRF